MSSGSRAKWAWSYETTFRWFWFDEQKRSGPCTGELSWGWVGPRGPGHLRKPPLPHLQSKLRAPAVGKGEKYDHWWSEIHQKSKLDPFQPTAKSVKSVLVSWFKNKHVQPSHFPLEVLISGSWFLRNLLRKLYVGKVWRHGCWWHSHPYRREGGGGGGGGGGAEWWWVGG